MSDAKMCPTCGRPKIHGGAWPCGSEVACANIGYERLSSAIAALKAHPAMTCPTAERSRAYDTIDALREAIRALPERKADRG